MKAVLVYQVGIANVFEVDTFEFEGRNAKRIMQGGFTSCAYFAKGLLFAGCDVETMACNRAGDITNTPWDTPLDDAPFSKQFDIVTLIPDRRKDR